MAKDSYITDFTAGNVTKQLLTFALPLFLSNLLQIVYNMADMAIVGQVLGKVGLAAVSVGGDIASFLTFLAMGFANAGQVIISQYIGAGLRSKLTPFIGTMLTFLTCCAVMLSVFCFYWREAILQLMNTPPEAFSEALDYATVCILGLVFIYGYNIVSAVLRGMGDSLHPFVFISVASVLNVALDLLFVMVLGYGSKGAAAATVISQGVSFFACCLYIYVNRRRYDLVVSRQLLIHIEPEMLLQLIKLGLPMAIKNASVQSSKLFVNSWINSYGVSVAAFAGIANKINSMVNLISNSFNAAGASMIGQNIGAHKYERVKATMFAVFKVTFAVALVLSFIIIVIPQLFYRIFTSDAEVIKIGLDFIPIAVLLFFGSAGRSGMNALINGSGNYLMNFLTAILDGIVLRIGLALFFGLVVGLKYYGFWLGDALAGFTPLVLGIFFYFSDSWKKSKIT